MAVASLMFVYIGIASRKIESVESAEMRSNPHGVSLAVEMYNL